MPRFLNECLRFELRSSCFTASTLTRWYISAVLIAISFLSVRQYLACHHFCLVRLDLQSHGKMHHLQTNNPVSAHPVLAWGLLLFLPFLNTSQIVQQCSKGVGERERERDFVIKDLRVQGFCLVCVFRQGFFVAPGGLDFALLDSMSEILLLLLGLKSHIWLTLLFLSLDLTLFLRLSWNSQWPPCLSLPRAAVTSVTTPGSPVDF